MGYTLAQVLELSKGDQTRIRVQTRLTNPPLKLLIVSYTRASLDFDVLCIRKHQKIPPWELIDILLH